MTVGGEGEKEVAGVQGRGRCEYQCGFSHLLQVGHIVLGQEDISHMEKVPQTERIHRWATVSQSDTQACRQMRAPIYNPPPYTPTHLIVRHK